MELESWVDILGVMGLDSAIAGLKHEMERRNLKVTN